MRAALAVGLGGLLGSLARYKLGGLVLHHTSSWRFPLSTFAVNLLGCALVGVLAGIAEHRHGLSPAARLFLITGFCGGFTTFSALAYETFELARAGDVGRGALNLALHAGLGLVAVWGGHVAAMRMGS